MKRVAIVQARMGSTRLPGKVLCPLRGKLLVDHVLDRVHRARSLDTVVVATTWGREEAPLIEHVRSRGDTKIFRGSAADVLQRFHYAAVAQRADVVVRVTADDPFKDPGLIDAVVERLCAEPSLAYVSNTIEPTFPEGLDIEAFTAPALRQAHQEAHLPSEREHVTPYIWKYPERFRCAQIHHSEDLSAWRCTVDREEDVRFASAVLERLGPGEAGLDDIVRVLRADPGLLAINGRIPRNEGYIRSLEAEEGR